MPITDTWQEWSTTAANNPPAGTAVPLMDDEIRNVKAELIKNAVALSGDQTIAGIKTFSAIPVLPASDPTTDNQAARKSYIDDAIAATFSFPTGTKLPFYQASAPTGWTQDTSANDRVIRIVSGTGGGYGGDWTLSGVGIDGHAITTDEMPSHNNGLTGVTWCAGGVLEVAGSYGNNSKWTQGGDQPHTHGITNYAWRPAYIDCIICAKD